MGTVAVYRHQLFKYSEPFIEDQAGGLERYDPLFVGEEVVDEPPEDANYRALPEPTSLGERIRRARYTALRDHRAFLPLLDDFDIDLVHAHFGIEGVYALDLAQRLDVPLVTTFHGFDATRTRASFLASGNPKLINYALFQGRLARDGDLFLCVSDYIRQRVLEKGFPPERTVKHYIGIDADAFDPPAGSPDEQIVLHIARLVEKKGTRYLIEAMPHIVERVPEARLVVVGQGPLLDELATLAEDLGVGENVDFRGRVSDAELHDWLTRASVFSLPSIHAETGDAEGLGMVLLEAAATRTPVVATESGGIPDAVQDGETGFLVPERDADALSRKIVRLLEDDDLRSRMGSASRSMVEDRFNLAEQSAKLEALYDRVLK